MAEITREEITKDKFKIVGKNLTKMESISRPNIGYWQDAWRRIRKNKVDELEKRIKSINPYIEIKKIDKFIDENNIQLLFEEKVDYIVDACDSIKTKEILIKECLERKIKFISCMGTAKKLDPTKLEITDIRKTSYDPLAKRIRKMVKDEHLNGKIPVICSTEKPKEIKKLGSISFVPSVAGIYITSYIINDIIGEK